MNEHPDIEEIVEFLSDMDAGELELSDVNSDWHHSLLNALFRHDGTRLRFVSKPKTVFTKRIEIPAPHRDRISANHVCYVACVDAEHFYVEWVRDHVTDREYQEWSERGLVYLNPEDAAAAGRAMLEREDE